MVSLWVVQMFTDLRCSPSCSRAGVHGTVSICPPDCFQYKGTFDVFTKIIRQVCLPCSVKKTRTFFFFFFGQSQSYFSLYSLTQELIQEGMARLWRGTNAGLALAVPMVCSPIYMWRVCLFWQTTRISELSSFVTGWNLSPFLRFVPQPFGRVISGECACDDNICASCGRVFGTVPSLYSLLSS